MKKHLLLLLVLAAVSATVFADEKSGSCGNGLNWSINNFKLTISGADVEMTTCERGKYPWSKYADEISIISVDNGTSIAPYAFADLKGLNYGNLISKKLKTIGEGAFAGSNFSYINIYAEEKITAATNAFEGFQLKEGAEAGKFASLTAFVYVQYELFYDYLMDAVWYQFQLRNDNQRNSLSGDMGTCHYEFDEKTGVVTISNAKGKEDGEFKLEQPWESPFYMDSQVKKVVVEEGVAAIGTGAFLYCENLETIILPSTFVMMAESSLDYETIEYYPFDGCSNLRTIECHATYPPDYPNDIFWYWINPAEINLYVREESTSYYKEDEYIWGAMNLHILPPVAQGTIEGGLGWRLSENGRLTITGEGAMPEWTSPEQAPWYKYMKDIKIVSVSYGVTSISPYAFKGADAIETLIIASLTLTVGKEAFVSATKLSEIICYNYADFIPQLDPTSMPANHNDIIVYVLTNKEGFEKDNLWSKYTITLIGAENAYIETEDIAATALSFDNIAIIWKALVEADQYKVTIESEDHSFTCTITFNAKTGDVLAVAKAPKHMAGQATLEDEAWTYTFFGLTEGVKYNITVVAMKEGQVLKTYKTNIETMSTGFDKLESADKAEKLLRDGQFLIRRDGKTYNAIGAELR